MPRIVRVFALEELGSMNEPVISTPVGGLSVRQTIILAAFLFIGWSGFNILSKFLDVVASAVFFVGFAVAGAVVAGKKTKSVPIEAQVYYMIFKPRKKVQRKGVGAKKTAASASAETVQKSLSMMIESEEIVPKKVSGELRDSFGKVLKNMEYYVYVNDKKYSEKAFVSDSMGRYEFFFVPPAAGEFLIKIVPKGYTVPSELIKVKVERVR
ncbi:MAG: hypothetical protein QXO47_10615 [Thermoproteota archaeon]